MWRLYAPALPRVCRLLRLLVLEAVGRFDPAQDAGCVRDRKGDRRDIYIYINVFMVLKK